MSDTNNTSDSSYNGSYSINELRKIRSYVLETLWKRSTSSLNEMRVKRKCGIITNDLKEFYLYDKKPKNFTETNEDFNVELPSYFDETLPIESLEFEIKYNEDNEEKATNFESNDSEISDNEPLQQQQQQQPDTRTKENVNNLENTFFIEEQIIPKQAKKINLEIVDEKESKRIEATNNYLKMSHECERGLCLRNLQIYEDYRLNNNEINCQVVYICDFCQIKLVSLNEMIDHLSKESHFSASEYYHESAPSTSFFDSTFTISNFDLKCLKTRQSIKIDKQNFSYLNGIFCPKCHQFFGNSILACALHYQYMHQTDEQIYSIGRQIETREMRIDKTHTCYQCGIKFKKLSDLNDHLSKSNHFPYAKNNQINVFFCPFDCSFSSNCFFTFKKHALNHSFFNRKVSKFDEEPSAKVNVKIYNTPTSYFHITMFREAADVFDEQVIELSALNIVLDLLKGLTTQNEILNKIKARRDHLVQITKFK